MLSVGLDLHKRYSQVEALEENGDRRSGARLVNEFEQIEGFFRSLGEPCRVVLEAGWNWGSMYDWLERVENVVEVQLAHPYGVRAIAAAQVKTDRIDARMLGQLLRVGLIPRAYIPEKETRQLREAVRQRLFLVRVRTMLKESDPRVAGPASHRPAAGQRHLRQARTGLPVEGRVARLRPGSPASGPASSRDARIRGPRDREAPGTGSQGRPSSGVAVDDSRVRCAAGYGGGSRD